MIIKEHHTQSWHHVSKTYGIHVDEGSWIHPKKLTWNRENEAFEGDSFVELAFSGSVRAFVGSKSIYTITVYSCNYSKHIYIYTNPDRNSFMWKKSQNHLFSPNNILFNPPMAFLPEFFSELRSLPKRWSMTQASSGIWITPDTTEREISGVCLYKATNPKLPCFFCLLVKGKFPCNCLRDMYILWFPTKMGSFNWYLDFEGRNPFQLFTCSPPPRLQQSRRVQVPESHGRDKLPCDRAISPGDAFRMEWAGCNLHWNLRRGIDDIDVHSSKNDSWRFFFWTLLISKWRNTVSSCEKCVM